jgi:hypothetical protein
MDHATLAQLIDGVIVLTVLECALLWAWRSRRGAAAPLPALWANALSGLCLMLALRTGVRGLPAPWIALCLLGAGLAHVTDLWWRWRRARAHHSGGLGVSA